MCFNDKALVCEWSIERIAPCIYAHLFRCGHEGQDSVHGTSLTYNLPARFAEKC